MNLLYNIGIYFYQLLIVVSSLFNNKAKLWIEGRKNWESKLKEAVKGSNKVIWFHAASLGEFEQGRPLIEKLKREESDVFILLTFFSPSGYEIQKNYKGADYVCYLPSDTKKNAGKFIEITKPKQAIFIKYEFWYNYLSQLKQRDIPLYLLSGIFRKDQVFFKFYGAWFRRQLESFTRFYIQDQTSVDLIKSIGYNNVLLTGDTRFDRVIEISETSSEILEIKNFVKDNYCLVVGSSWPVEEEMLAEYINNNPNQKYIIAPHEIDKRHIKEIESRLNVSYQLWSEYKKDKEAVVLIVDSIGLLSSIYKYADIAYVGGAFGSGLHNILEAAVYGIPVLFGPKISKFQEAYDLIDFNAAFSISDKEELFQKLNVLKNQKTLSENMGKNAKSFIYKSKGASKKVYEQIRQNGL